MDDGFLSSFSGQHKFQNIKHFKNFKRRYANHFNPDSRYDGTAAGVKE
jgi:hypothetical protein